MSSLLGLGTTVTLPCCPFMRSWSPGDHGFSTLNSMGMSFCWPFSSKFKSKVMCGCTVYPSFLFCPLLGITFTCAPALLSKRTLTKRVDDEDSTDGEKGRLLINSVDMEAMIKNVYGSPARTEPTIFQITRRTISH